MSRSIALATPFLFLVVVAYGSAFALAGCPPSTVPFLAGVLGWIAALVLRAPVGIAAMRLWRAPTRVQTAVVASSGPLEEAVRLAAVLLVGRDVGSALWLGLGWAAVEVVYSIVNAFALVQLGGRTDPEAEQARALLPPAALARSAPWWGVAERAGATALHVGFTLIVAALPPAVVATAIVHSATNLAFLAMLRRHSTARIMAALAVAGGLCLIVGLAMHGTI